MLTLSLLLLSLALQLSADPAASVQSLSQDSREESTPPEFLICRQCGTDIGDSYYLYYQASPSSKVNANVTIFGKSGIQVQVLVNPIGVQFTIINTSKALCSGIGDWVSAHTWYPGFLWKFCVCPHCSAHLGWIFEPIATASPDRTKPSAEGFYALIVDNILGESYIQSLMVNAGVFHS